MRTVLCYLEKDGSYLMLCRNKKKNDLNANKWVGVGGKLEPGETPDAALLREVKEETGLALSFYTYRGLIHFFADGFSEDMYLYTAPLPDGELADCDEGTLALIPKEDVLSLPLWEGDRYFLEPLIKGDCEPFVLSLRYRGDVLISAVFEEKR